MTERLFLAAPPLGVRVEVEGFRGDARCGVCGSLLVRSFVGRSVVRREPGVVWSECVVCGAVSDPARVA